MQVSVSWNRFLCTYKEVDFAPHQVIGLVLHVGDVEKFPHALGFQSLDPFFRVGKQGTCFTAEALCLLSVFMQILQNQDGRAEDLRDTVSDLI